MPKAPRLRRSIRNPDQKQGTVNWVFDRVAARYDLGNDLMSLGWHTRWKRRLVDEYIQPAPKLRILDIAAGTGDVSFMLADRFADAEVIGSDISPAMLAVAEQKRPAHLADRVRFEIGDCSALPYPDASFDLVTCVYAGRGLPDLRAYTREVHRVLRPGGSLWHLDFARPKPAAWDKLVRGWMTVSGAALGIALNGHPKSYIYIPISLRNYRGQDWLAGVMREEGFTVSMRETFGTLMAYHEAVKPL